MKRFGHQLLILFISLCTVNAQTSDYKSITNPASLKQTFANKVNNTASIESNFTQVKQMKLLKENLHSTGKFYYKKEQKVRIEYLKPYNYLVVLNKGQLFVKDNQGKGNKVNTKNSKSMKAINQIMIDCMSGNIFNNSDFTVTSFENNNSYLLRLTPKSSEIKSMFKNIEVFFDKKNTQIERLLMNENNGDQTDMKFKDIKTNINLSDALFQTR